MASSPDASRVWRVAAPDRSAADPRATLGVALLAALGAAVAWPAGDEVALGVGLTALLLGLSVATARRRARAAPASITLHAGYLAVRVDGSPRRIPVGSGAPTRVGVDEARHLAWVALPRFAETVVLVGDLSRTPVSLAWPAAPVPNGARVALDAADLATLARAIEAD
jgi:hypothetical protein